MKTQISCIILARNEEKNIAQALQSVQFCDEIILIDDYSIDQTVAIAKKAGAIIFQRRLNEDFSGQRNFALDQAQREWILYIDSDEEVSPGLQSEILAVCRQNTPPFSAYYTRRQDMFWGNVLRHGETCNMKLLRLVKKRSGRWIGKVHETLQTNFKVKTFKNPLLHHPHQTIAEFLREVNIYSSMRAHELYLHHQRPSLFSILFYPLGKFILNYGIRLGFLDGAAGFVYAFMMSFHSFLVRGKLFLIHPSHRKQ